MEIKNKTIINGGDINATQSIQSTYISRFMMKGHANLITHYNFMEMFIELILFLTMIVNIICSKNVLISKKTFWKKTYL